MAIPAPGPELLNPDIPWPIKPSEPG
jgi:hypothetical protein